MRRILLLTLLVVAFVGSVKGQGTAGNEADTKVKKEILKIDDELNQAGLNGIADAFGRFLADDIAWTNANGEILTKAQVLDDFRSGRRKMHTLKHDDVRLHVYGNTVVLTGRSTSTYQYKGKESIGPRRYTRNL
jgi:hypothetical protein